MRKISCLVAALGAMIATAAAEDLSVSRQTAIAELTEIKINDWRRIYAERDAEALEKFLLDEFVVLTPVGKVSTKAEEVAFLRSTPRDGEPSDFLYTIRDIIFAGDDTAVVFGHGDSTRKTEDGKPCRHTYWSSNTLKRVDGKWKALFSHVSDASCTPMEE